MKPNFENHRKDKIPLSDLISIIDEDGIIWNGWTNGRDLDQINKDFGIKDEDWFFFNHNADAYVLQHRNKYKK